jgi:hypothetical protein
MQICQGWVAVAAYAVAYVLACGRVPAGTLQTTGAGLAVSVTNLSANFDAVTSTAVIPLENYTEGGLAIITAGRSWGADTTMAPLLDPFHRTASADRSFFALSTPISDWVTIRPANLSLMFGVEFLYGNTWTNADIQQPWGNSEAVVDWQTWKNGSILSSGTIGPVPMVQVGTFIGFYDAEGFDELVVRATLPTSGDPNLQALALDAVAVMQADQPPAPVVTINAPGGFPALTVWSTIPGRQYRLLRTDSIVVPEWTPMPAQQPDGWVPGGGKLMFSDFAALGTSTRFYRVEAR